MPGVGAFGPYPVGNRWRVLVRENDETSPSGHRQYAKSFTSESDAEEYKRAADEALRATEIATVQDAVEAYAEHLESKGNGAASCEETPRRLRWLLADALDGTLEALTPLKAKRLYEKVTTATYPKGGETRTYAVDTCKNTLAEVKTFSEWCMRKRWIKENPFAGIKDERQRHHGKVQLTRDEARAFNATALGLAAKGDDGAVAALMTLIMGLRAGEITKRVVRDLDDNGTILIVERAKTRAGDRTVFVPEVLRPFLQRAIKGKAPDAFIFATEKGGEHWRDWPTENVRRICKLAKVREVCGHSMRGLHASLAIEAGMASAAVARSLGHESATTTLTSYATPEAARGAQQRAALAALAGDKAKPRRAARK
jgi:integrase